MRRNPRMKWIAVEDKLPKIGQEVLCFFTIDEFQYYVVGKIAQITIVHLSEDDVRRSVEWNNANHDAITPTHWFPLEPPNSYAREDVS